ncbi:MAG: hypothetical protein ABI690_26120 [Chloroflexota bacterium]
MLKIDRATGDITWENYVLYPRLFHDDFAKKYPQLKPVHDIHTPDGMHERGYHFPMINLDTYEVEVKITYFDSRLSGIYIGRENSIESDDEATRWRHGLPGWVRVAKNWLITQLGQPHEIRPGVLYDEKSWLTPEEIQHLQLWGYGFEWGEAGFWYDGLQQPGDIYIHYQEISNWDELAVECETLLQKQQQQNGRYISHLLTTRSLIDILRQHFDYQKTKPRVYSRGLQFQLSDLLDTRVTMILLTAYPNEIKKRYEISRSDTHRKAFIPADDHSQLIDNLREFLESENM